MADVGAFVVNRYLQLTSYGDEERFGGEFERIAAWYELVGQNLVSHGAFDPSGKDGLRGYYRNLRPCGWSAREWFVG